MDDPGLLTRLLRSEADAAVLLANAMYDQGSPAVTVHEIECGIAVSLGPGRYLNRLLCTSTSLTDADIDEVTTFFSERQLEPAIQIVDTTDGALETRLRRRGFEHDWQRLLMAARPTDCSRFSFGERLRVSSVSAQDLDVWLDVLALGNGAVTVDAREVSDEYGRAAHHIEGSTDLLAWLGDDPAACGSLQPVGNIGWLGGAATLPEHRRRGLQRELLDIRIATAGFDGCDYVAATALPDATSARNLERAGLSVVVQQSVWTIPTKE